MTGKVDSRASRRGSFAPADKGIWEGILTEVATAARAPDAKVLCLGRPGIGKRTLLQALHQHACPLAANTEAPALAEGGHSRAVALDFAHFGARDPELEEAKAGQDFNCPAACSVLILEDPVHEKIFLSRLKPKDLSLCAALICLDLKTPWTMMEDLAQWLEILKRVVGDLMQQLPLGEQDRLREQVSEELAEYEAPEAPDTEAESQAKSEAKSEGAEVVLSYNFGIPLIVVVTRSDTSNALESPKTLGWSETIEAYLRNECLPFGAAIVYTAAQGKVPRNLEALYEYLMHRLYGHKLKTPPNVPSRDALFVPGGWDSRERIDKTASALEGGLDRAFESVVVSLDASLPSPPQEVKCDDMQKFLKSSSAVLQKIGAVSARSDKAKAALAGASAKKAPTELSGAGSGKRASIDAGKAGVSTKGDVANFFQNLLTRGQSGANLTPEKRASTASAKAAPSAPAGGSGEEPKLAPPSPAQGSAKEEAAPSAAPEAKEEAAAPKEEAAAPKEEAAAPKEEAASEPAT